MLSAAACSTGQCRRNADTVLEEIDAKPPTGYEQQDMGQIRIAKPDGSLQCGYNEGVSLEQMAKNLIPEIRILAAEKLNDGLMRIQSCGAETGVLNVYTIRHSDLRVAQKAGFVLYSKPN